MVLEVPKPVLPQLEGFDESYEEAEVEEDEQDLFRERLYENVANLIGFVSAIGLPRKLFLNRHKYYRELALETGFSQSLIETIEYYFPDFEFSPAFMLLLAMSVYGSLVLTDRMELNEQLKAMRQKQMSGEDKHVEEKKAEKRELNKKVKILEG